MYPRRTQVNYSVVRLVLAKRVSGGSAAVVMAPRCSGSGPIVLQPWMEDAGLRSEDFGVSADAEGYMHLLVENSSRPPKLIDVGAVLWDLRSLMEVLNDQRDLVLLCWLQRYPGVLVEYPRGRVNLGSGCCDN